MSIYYPDNWVIIQIKGDNPHYKVLAGWSGGYIDGSSWKLNSGITRLEEDGNHCNFYGHSGSLYSCSKGSYGLRMNNAYVWDKLKNLHGGKVELLPEDTEWSKIDWILSTTV